MEVTTRKVEIEIAGAQVTIPEATIADLWLGKLRGGEGSAAAAPPSPLRIGQVVNGEMFMGIVRGEDGAPDCRVWDLGEAPSTMSWNDAKAWADGKGGRLSTRRESALMFANRGDGQFQDAWYWCLDEYAGDESFAWCQYFGYGDQAYDHKSDLYRARAVRAEPIQ